ncbi:MAG TPA: hypothetical protein VMT01_00110 [Candidatus Acidoferrum sp.]|nr:hypothetical protein [Candidatus Acidoferrum sp.]
MVDVQTISIAIASASVVAGVAYYALQLRHQTKIRQTDLIIRLYSFIANRELLEAWDKVRDREFKDADDYRKKYGGLVELNLIYTLYQEFGMLLQRKLIDPTLIEDLIGRQTVLLVYEKLKGFHEDTLRGAIGTESSSFDYLYSEMKKREQQR